jgi:hypothetical protein
MNASQLRYPEIVIQCRNTSFASYYPSKVSEMLRNTRKHHFGSNGVSSQLWYPEIVHSGSDASFASFYQSKVSEILRNNSKHHFGSNRCSTTSLPRNSAFSPQTQVLHLFTCRRLVKCYETLPNITLAPID